MVGTPSPGTRLAITVRRASDLALPGSGGAGLSANRRQHRPGVGVRRMLRHLRPSTATGDRPFMVPLAIPRFETAADLPRRPAQLALEMKGVYVALEVGPV